MSGLRGYDAWKLRAPDDDQPDEPPHPDCTCYGTRSWRAVRDCAVHGEDPDAARERRAEDREFIRDQERDE